jgi:hypothetical protein
VDRRGMWMGMYGIDDSVWMHLLACLFEFIICLLGDFYANAFFSAMHRGVAETLKE